MNLMKIDSGLKMNSIEIADLVESRHDDVKRSIDRLVQKNVIVQPPLADEQTVDSLGRKRSNQVYVFSGEKGRRDSIVVVAQLCPEFTARLVDRWQELEAKEQKNQIVLPNFTDPIEAATAWIEQYKEKQVALKQLEVAKPKVEFVDTFVDRGSNRNITSVAKELGITAIALGKWLRAKGYMNKSTKKQEWNKEFIDKGYGVQKLFNTEVKEDTFKSGSQVLVTPAGDLFIKEQVKKHGLVVDFDKQE